MDNKQHKKQYLDEIYENLAPLGMQEERKDKETSVFLARHKLTGKIAVKKYVEADKIAVYEKLQQIDDIHLEKVYDYAADGKQGIVLVEYISGTSLEELMQEKGTFSVQEAVLLIEALVKTLLKVHAEGIVHRDINPNNIMISGDGVLKLVDFGIARQTKEKKTQDTEILGTPGYAAPEQFGFLQTDKRADIYAVGVLLNVLLTGCLPTEKIYDGFPFVKIIRRCMEIDVKQRYQSDEELLKDLPGEEKELYARTWIPGFRTGVVWKKVTAVVGYFLMFLLTFIMLESAKQSWHTILLELAAVILYLWIPFLLAVDIGYWERRWIFAKQPRVVMIAVRIILILISFYNGVMLDAYIGYNFLGKIQK
ncbi:MAG: serine/threonine protein kinase [Clostridium sp.]|nr:serine/threonine protein kinase [Clostridium sp.]